MKTNDPIDRQTAIDAHERIFDRCEEIEAHLPEGDPDRVGYKMYPDWLTVWKYLHQVPSAQPEIIRCKDCKWSDWYTAVDGKWYCHCLETGAAGRTEDDYCSYAEREEGETDAD